MWCKYLANLQYLQWNLHRSLTIWVDYFWVIGACTDLLDLYIVGEKECPLRDTLLCGTWIDRNLYCISYLPYTFEQLSKSHLLFLTKSKMLGHLKILSTGTPCFIVLYCTSQMLHFSNFQILIFCVKPCMEQVYCCHFPYSICFMSVSPFANSCNIPYVFIIIFVMEIWDEWSLMLYL